MNTIRFVLDDQIVTVDFNKADYHPSTTVLNYLRSLPGHRGTKEGCGEGDCGACTIVLGELEDGRIKYKAVNSCLLFLSAIHGKQVITIENLAQQNGNEIKLHPVQQAIVENYGSQCGFCTPGVIMTMFALYKSDIEISKKNIIECLAGNLCRCTGYEPISKAVIQACNNRQPDHFDDNEPKIKRMLLEIKEETKSKEIHTTQQRYFLPSNPEDALHFCITYPLAYIVNGATDTAIRQNKNYEFLPEIIDLSCVREFKEIRIENNGIYAGAGVSLESFKKLIEEQLPQVSELLEMFASWQIRNIATIGGNLATSSPIGDLIPLFIVLRARLELIDTEKSRWVDIEDFITGYRKNCLMPGELLKGVFFPKPENDIIIRSEKISTRRHLDISTLSIALRLKKDPENRIEEIILAYGGLADKPKRADGTEKFLEGKILNESVIEQSTLFIENDFTPISDARASASYRIIVAKNLLIKLLLNQ